MWLSSQATNTRQALWGLAPKLQGTIMTAQPIGGRTAATIEQFPAGFVQDFYRNQAQRVSPGEMASGETGSGLLTGKYQVQTQHDGWQWRAVEQLGSGHTGSVVGASTWTNNTADRKPPNYYDARLRANGVSSWRNGHGTYMIHNGSAWATGANVFLARDNDLKAATGNPSDPLELAAQTYAIQFGRDVRPKTYKNGNAAVAEGPRGTVHIENLGLRQGDELLAVVFSNVRNGRPIVAGGVGLAGDKDIKNSPAELAVRVGRDGQWIFDYLSLLAWGGMESAVPRFYDTLDGIVARATGNVG